MRVSGVQEESQAVEWLREQNISPDNPATKQKFSNIMKVFKANLGYENPNSGDVVGKLTNKIARKKATQFDAAFSNVIQVSVIAHLMGIAGVRTEGEAESWLVEHDIPPSNGDSDLEGKTKHAQIMDVFRDNLSHGNQDSDAVIAGLAKELVGKQLQQFKTEVKQFADDEFDALYHAILAKGVPLYIGVILLHIASYITRQQIKLDYAEREIRMQEQIKHERSSFWGIRHQT
eukprot:3483485-Rhodomonas_salina.1